MTMVRTLYERLPVLTSVGSVRLLPGCTKRAGEGGVKRSTQQKRPLF